MEQKADIALEANIDNAEFEESQLIELRVPLHTPYMADTKEFERYAGELEIKGIHYTYVKRKIENGELVLMCLPNKNKTRLQHSKVEFFKLVNDLGNSSQHKEKNSSDSFKSLVTEYSPENNSWSLQEAGLVFLQHAAAMNSLHTSAFTDVVKQPPRA